MSNFWGAVQIGECFVFIVRLTSYQAA